MIRNDYPNGRDNWYNANMKETKPKNPVLPPEIAAAIGRINSPKKQAQARENGKLGGAPLLDLGKLECSCPNGEHRKNNQKCRRGRVEYRREWMARPERNKAPTTA